MHTNVIASAQTLFERFFLPLYPEDARGDLARAPPTHPNPAQNPRILAELDAIADVFARLAPPALGAPDLVLDRSDASVHRLGALLTRERRDAWLAPDAAGGLPAIVNLVTHGAVYVGACVVASHGGAWQVRRPLWESQVRLESAAGTAVLAPFSWWLKSLSDEEIDHTRLGARYRTHVEVPTLDPSSLALIATADRRIPRLAKVRYDTLHKHLKAHLPELRGVGDDFPSAERLDELGFKWLDFKLLGDGRMLLIHGPAAAGVPLFWLDAGGFVKSAYYPADSFPEHLVQTEGDKLRVVLPIQKTMQVHETLWWGA